MQVIHSEAVLPTWAFIPNPKYFIFADSWQKTSLLFDFCLLVGRKAVVLFFFFFWSIKNNSQGVFSYWYPLTMKLLDFFSPAGRPKPTNLLTFLLSPQHFSLITIVSIPVKGTWPTKAFTEFKYSLQNLEVLEGSKDLILIDTVGYLRVNKKQKSLGLFCRNMLTLNCIENLQNHHSFMSIKKLKNVIYPKNIGWFTFVY